jgi:hypothetical protein
LRNHNANFRYAETDENMLLMTTIINTNDPGNNGIAFSISGLRSQGTKKHVLYLLSA